MLYARWQQTLSLYRDEVAVTDAVSGSTWTFAALQQSLDSLPALATGALHVASMADGVLAFVLQTLWAWRDAAVLCPMEREGGRVPDVRGMPSGIAHLKMTSGSTGEPRTVMFREEQLVADAENIRTTMELDRACPNVAVISVAHSYGFSNLVLPLLLQGHPLVIVPDALPSSQRAACAAGHPVTLPAVPAMWRAWWRSGLIKEMPIALAISAGAPLPLDVERGVFEETGIKIHNFLGSSECGGIAYDRTSVPREDASLAGTAMDGVTLSLSEGSRLIVESAAAGEGYWPAGDDALGGGKFFTSDLVELQNEQVLMRGRMSDAINIAGRKLNPADVEAALLSCEGVRHCVVFGVASADPARCEDTIACVNAAENLTPARLASLLGERLQTWQLPRKYWLCPNLAPNARGKISRAEWRERWLSAHAVKG
jgi:long-chain acyl-CoA synthetase